MLADMFNLYKTLFSFLVKHVISTHYYDSNLIWRTVSRRVDEVIPSDRPRREAKNSYAPVPSLW